MSKRTLLFISCVLLSTWVIALSIKYFRLSQQPMTVVMIFPMLLALVFILTSKEKKISVLGWRFPRIRYFLISIFLPILQVALVVSVGFSLRLLSFNYHHILSSKPTSNIWLNLVICIPAAFIPFILLPFPSFIIGWLNHVGEEFAWRGYLFRNISKESNNLLKGAVFTGFVWWAWHLPMFWISPVLGELSLSKMAVTVLLSFFSITGTAVIYSWIYVKSRSIWTPTIMHLFWNLYRGILTGRLADGHPGVFIGDLWLINGEGIIGMIITALFGLFFFFLMSRLEKIKELLPY